MTMNKIHFTIVLCVVAIWAGMAGAAEEQFVYDDHARRDPFWRLLTPGGVIINYEIDILITDMILEGIIFDPGRQNLAIVNGKVIKAGDTIGLYTVIAVEEKRVLLRKGNEDFVLNLKKEAQ